MKSVVLIMKRASFAQGLLGHSALSPDLHLSYEPDYTNALSAVRTHAAQAALLEVAEGGEYDVDYCLSLCDQLRQLTPECRLMLMCPENDRRAVLKAVEAKRTGIIHDFVFYDVSVEYLMSDLLTL